MKYQVEKLTMSDGNINFFHQWIPDGDIKAVVILSHGMTEHAARYDRLGNIMCENGYALFCEDHRGHGETAKYAEQQGTGKFGYLADHDGFFRVVEDIHEEVLVLRERYSDKKLVLLGHSFGSFITQCYVEKYGNTLDGVIICGSAGPRNAMVKCAKMVGNMVKGAKGAKHVTPFIDKLAFGNYNDRIKPSRTKFDWLTRDATVVDLYISDDWCGFVCTAGFFCDMFTGLTYIHAKENMAKVPADLPVYFIAGDADPVGDYGKTVKNLFEIYKANGVKDCSLKLYPGARHELFNETNKEEVESDVLAFVARVTA